MTVMAILQEVDKCIRCNGCVIACKREWNMKNPTDIQDVIERKPVVSASQRLAIKSQKRVDMGPFIRFTCWHCPDPPCAGGCPFKAITKAASGAVNVDPAACKPDLCASPGSPKPCQIECQRGGYPKVGEVYESGVYSGVGVEKMNKCVLCEGRAGLTTANDALPTRHVKVGGVYISPLGGNEVPELEHEPACVSSCPAKAMIYDTRANIINYLETASNGYYIGDTKNWIGNGSMFWASKKVLLTPPKADPFIEDHATPMVSSLAGKLVVPTLVIGGLAALSARRTSIEKEATTGGEV